LLQSPAKVEQEFQLIEGDLAAGKAYLPSNQEQGKEFRKLVGEKVREATAVILISGIKCNETITRCHVEAEAAAPVLFGLVERPIGSGEG